MQDYCVDDLDITPDGTIWVLASAGHDDPYNGLNVITPEAVTATEQGSRLAGGYQGPSRAERASYTSAW